MLGMLIGTVDKYPFLIINSRPKFPQERGLNLETLPLHARHLVVLRDLRQAA